MHALREPAESATRPFVARRNWALWKAKLAGSLDTLKRALTVDAEELDNRAPAELAEAKALVREGSLLRGGIAKYGQLRAYLHGTTPEARAALADLWTKVPGDPPAAIRAVIAEQLGAPPEQLFAHWDDQPFAAASLGQVHGAVGVDGAALAVKVQYPTVAAALTDDLSSKSLLRKMMGGDLGDGVDDTALAVLRQGLLDELDYRREAQSLQAFADAWRDDVAIVVPGLVADRSAERVLTMHRLVGAPLQTIVDDPDEPRRSRVAATLFRFAFGSPLRGLVNADPHPGNYLVLDADAGRVGFLDFGCSVTLAPEIVAAERQLWRAVIVRDGEALRHATNLQGLVGQARIFESEAWREWEQALSQPFLRRGPFLLEPNRVRILIDVTARLVRQGRVGLPAPVLLLWRQRLGALTVLAQLRPRLDFRRLLADLLDHADRVAPLDPKRQHPTPLYDRYP